MAALSRVRIPLLAGFCFMMAGNTLYLSLQFFAPADVAIVMMVARFVAGCGTGNMSLLRAYASTSSCKADRARAIACVSGGIATGTLIGPGPFHLLPILIAILLWIIHFPLINPTNSAFQLFFTPLGPDGIYVLPFYRLNIYNSPALFSLLLNIAGFLVMFFAFEEKYDVLQADAAKVCHPLDSSQK
ncbi:hypothetical protein ANCCEY_02618 [Ancylostoma ceylanicum]|uniref:Major facilitator superfamily (MFS) profile domain-containing protein n=1 Tax=Ancylostoma ceylanicum TaxID=53326 RepID=A0A0D6M7C4_9BILA|nr:hypothetical protein ANCCEY_02618 [Ancylostoma ceylanicum]